MYFIDDFRLGEVVKSELIFGIFPYIIQSIQMESHFWSDFSSQWQ